MIKAVLFVALFALVALGRDICLDRSIALKWTDGMSSLGDGFLAAGYNAASLEEIRAVMEMLDAATGVKTTLATPAIGAYVGFGNDNFYFVQTDAGEISFWTRNEEFFGDGIMRSWATTADITDGTATVDASEFPTTARDWYIAGTAGTQSWVTYTFFEANLGQSIVDGTSYDLTYGAVFGADRDFAEPCDYCLQSTDLVPVGDVAATDGGLSEVLSITNAAGMRQASAKFLLSQIKNAHSDEIGFLYIGTDNGDFFGVIQCKNTQAQFGTECSNMDAPIAAFSDSVSGGRLIFYTLDVNGNIGSIIRDDIGAYRANVRPWFLQQNGWTDEYLFVTGGFARTYTKQFSGGVVGVDPSDTAVEDACGPAAPCEENEKPKHHGNGSHGKGDVTINFSF